MDYYLAIEESSKKMLQAAQDRNWSEVVQQEGACAVLIEQLRKLAQAQKLAPEQRNEKTKIMQRILSNDAQIRDITEPWLFQLGHEASEQQVLH
jgi:flagellar protein FliT